MENAEQPINYIVDAISGEVKTGMFKGDRLVRKKQIEHSIKSQEENEESRMHEFGQDKKFSMLSEFSAKQLADEKLTASEYRILLVMISNTHYKSGLIAFGNNQPVTREWLTKHLGINRKTTDSSVKTLIDRGIIAQNTTNHKTKYFFNPYIQYRGKWINKTLYEMFKNTKWAKNKKN